MVASYCLLAAAVAVAASQEVGQSEQCQSVLKGMEKYGDFEVRALCRAQFPPQVCGEANRVLGVRPWAADRIRAACDQWVATWPSDDAARVLKAATAVQTEDTVAKKAKRAAKRTASQNLKNMAPMSKSLEFTTTTKTTTALAPGSHSVKRQRQTAAPFDDLLRGIMKAKQRKYEELPDAAPLASVRLWPMHVAVMELAVAGLAACGLAFVYRCRGGVACGDSTAIVEETHLAAGSGNE